MNRMQTSSPMHLAPQRYTALTSRGKGGGGGGGGGGARAPSCGGGRGGRGGGGKRHQMSEGKPWDVVAMRSGLRVTRE
jgi:hypothetical protein